MTLSIISQIVHTHIRTCKLLSPYYPFSINTWLPDTKCTSIFHLLLPGVSCLQTGGNNLITAAIPANRPDPRRLVRHYRVTSSACPILWFLICFLNAGLWADESVISHLHDNTLHSVELWSSPYCAPVRIRIKNKTMSWCCVCLWLQLNACT